MTGDPTATHSQPTNDLLSCERVIISPGRMRVIVRVCEGAPSHTNEVLAAKACAAHPTLRAHSCINSHGPSFGAVIENTPTPHLLEHLIIAEQIEMSADPQATYVGNTHWLQQGETAQVEVNFTDDLSAVHSLHNALAILNR